MKDFHELKILPCYYKAVCSGKKLFEYRKFDRNFKVGDTIRLRCWSKKSGYSGESISVIITYILDSSCGLDFVNGWVILGIRILFY
jgi:hypothetical protein